MKKGAESLENRKAASADSLMMSHPQLRQIRELLDANDGVVQRWLERLGHGVGQDHSDHHRQDV